MISALLSAELPDGSGEPDYLTRVVGVYVAAQLFELRDPWAVVERLEKVRPSVARDLHLGRPLNYGQANIKKVAEAIRQGVLREENLPPGLLSRAR